MVSYLSVEPMLGEGAQPGRAGRHEAMHRRCYYRHSQAPCAGLPRPAQRQVLAHEAQIARPAAARSLEPAGLVLRELPEEPHRLGQQAVWQRLAEAQRPAAGLCEPTQVAAGPVVV